MPRTWRDATNAPQNLLDLLETFHSLQRQFHPTSKPDHFVPLAFRGMADVQQELEPSLQYKFKIETHDDAGLAIELGLIDAFQKEAWRFLGELERKYLLTTKLLDTPGAEIWNALAIARHYGVPTRLLDWTLNISVAAFFAACHHPEKDGAVWWFSQADFQEAVHLRWDDWEVPAHEKTREREMEKKAFTPDATPWVSKVHHSLPFARMEKQAGFFTACGRLGMRHNDAIDALDDGNVRRGLVIIRCDIKEQLLDHLESIGFRASTIDYPGADVVGTKLANPPKPYSV